jgi:hypothetical protein
MSSTATTTLPIRSSKLAQPVSTHSPIPVSPVKIRSYTRRRAKFHPNTASISPPPKKPLLWLWSCHLCKRRYPLGATRRCLEDGHIFCAGITEAKGVSQKAGRKVFKRHTPCSSEFDYLGWKAWGEWRRRQPTLQDILHYDMPWTRSCGEYCDFPSECRWAVSSPISISVVNASRCESETGSSNSAEKGTENVFRTQSISTSVKRKKS